MSLTELPLCYCTNVHPGRTVPEVLNGLDHYTLPVKGRLGQKLAAGLWLAKSVVGEIVSGTEGARRLHAELQRRQLTCHTLNAFPYGDFHSRRVKENVYLPDWADSRRLEYTRRCALVLAALLPDDGEGSLSTLPLGFKEFPHPPDFADRAVQQLIDLARFLHERYQSTGKRLRLAIEPEPFCLLETTQETLAFFQALFDRAESAGLEHAVREHIGVCFDVCHQAVEFENVAESIARLHRAGIRLNKVHITCALQVDKPGRHPERRETLARFVEPRYLHQTLARASNGGLLRAVDLTEKLALHPPEEFAAADEWRVHFHVPVNAEQLGPLRTTRRQLREALGAVAQLDYAPHLEVETYTWQVLPGEEPVDLVDGLTAELQATHHLLQELRRRGNTCAADSHHDSENS